MKNILAILSDDINLINQQIGDKDTLLWNWGGQNEVFPSLAIKKDVETQLEKMKGNGNPNIVVVYGHGSIDSDGNYFILTGRGKGLASKQLFPSITQKLGTATDVFIATCHSGGAIEDVHILPKGSQVISVCDKKQTAQTGSNVDFRRRVQSMSGEPTAYKMLLEYLDILYKRGSSARDNPQLAISGMNDWISCGALLDNKRGKPIEYLDAKGESVSSFLNHCWANTGDRGRAISMCLRSEFGRQLTSENYKPFVEQSAVERLLQLRNGKPADVLSSAANSSVTRTNR